MPVNLRNRSYVTALDFSTDEINYLLNLSLSLKKSKAQGLHIKNRPLVGKNIILLFQKDSTRTRAAFEAAAADLGASVTYFGESGSNFGKKESVIDTAKVLGRMYDGIQFRGFKQSDVEALAKHSGVPCMERLNWCWTPNPNACWLLNH